MPHRIICCLEVYKTCIQFSTGFLKCVLIKECFQTKDVITGSLAFFKANLRDVYEFFFSSEINLLFKQFVSILHRQLRTHIGQKLSGLDESPFLCTGVINPLHQISGTHPTIRIKLNSFTKQFSSIAKECLIISLETLSTPGDFPFLSDLTIFLSSALLVNLLMN